MTNHIHFMIYCHLINIEAWRKYTKSAGALFWFVSHIDLLIWIQDPVVISKLKWIYHEASEASASDYLICKGPCQGPVPNCVFVILYSFS